MNFIIWREFFNDKNKSEYALFKNKNDIGKEYIGLANEKDTKSKVINSANAIKIKEIIENEIIENENIYDELYGTYQYIKLTIHNFKKMLESNNDITLDEAILKFEKSNFDTLEEFAESKNRKADGYRTQFGNLFEKAKNMNNKN
jgi:hypothetical protein